MSLNGVTTLVRDGVVYSPPEDLLSKFSTDFEQGAPPKETEFSISETQQYVGVFEPSVTLHIKRGEMTTTVTETVRFGWRWVLNLLLGSLLIALGEAFGWLSVTSPTASFALSVLGTGVTSATYAAGARYKFLAQNEFSETNRQSLLIQNGVFSGCFLCIVLAVTNVISVIAAVGLMLVTLTVVSERHPASRNDITTWVKQRLPRFPRVSARHSMYSIGAAVVLWVYIVENTTLQLVQADLVVTAGAAALVVTVGLLTYIPTRGRARVHAFGAAVVSGAYVVLVVAALAVNSRVTGSALNQESPFAVLALTLGLLLLWWSLWWIWIVNPEDIQTEFSAKGRRVSTHVAALFAYLSIMGSGALGLSTIAFAFVLWKLITAGITLWFGLLTVAFLLPLGYFVAGSLYQLANVIRLVAVFNRHATVVPPDRLPVETDYPVKTVPSDVLLSRRSMETSDSSDTESDGVLFAAAYADPFGRAIVLSEYAFTELSDAELAAIISHEESHFQYRGAQLQFLFATLPAFALMGKNVVFSIYDFFRRELTADQNAYVALSGSHQKFPKKSLHTVINRFTREGLKIDMGRVGFLPTMLSVPERATVGSLLEQWFELFYGDFAGTVHPDTTTRLRALHHASSISVTTESEPEARSGEILRILEEEDGERRFG